MDPTRDAQQSFEDLFLTHHQAIYRYCIRRLGTSDAEDAAAEVFAVAWRRRETIPDGETRRAWLYGVAFRVVGNRHRSARRQSSLTARIQGSIPRSLSPEEATDGELILTALDRLSSSDREILQLATWDDLDRGEIAQVLGINENATDQRLHRARRRLRAEYERVSEGARPAHPKEAST